MMTGPPMPPPGFVLEDDEEDRPDPWQVLRREGFVATNGFRTDQDTAAIRRQGYTPARYGAHPRGEGVDLDHPTLSRAEQTRRLRELAQEHGWEGATVLDEGHHRHFATSMGRPWAPGTPGTPNFGLPPLPDGFVLEQRGAITPDNFNPDGWPAPEPPPAPPPAVDPDSLRAATDLADFGKRAAERANQRPAAPQGEWQLTMAERAPPPPPPPPADMPETVTITRRDDPRMAGVNARLGAMYEAGAPESEMLEYLSGFGVNPSQIEGWRNWINFRRTPDFQRWRDAPPDQRPPMTINLDDILLSEPAQGLRRPAPDAAPQEVEQWTRDRTRLMSGGASIQNFEPAWAENMGRAAETVLSPLDAVAGEGYSRDRGALTADIAGHWLSPVPMAEWAADASRKAHEARMGGDLVAASQHEAEAAVATLSIIPIFGRARNAGKLAREAFSEIEQIAMREGIDAADAGSEAAIAAALRRNWGQLSPETREVVQGMAVGQEGPNPLGGLMIEDLRRAATMPPSLFDRAAERFRAMVGGGRRQPPEPPPGAGTGASTVPPAASAPRTAPVPPLSAVTTPAQLPGTGDLWRLDTDALEQALAARTAEDRGGLARAFGSEERVRRFEELDRMRNSSDPRRSDEGSRLFDAEFGNLTPEQERLVYGIGETHAQADEIRDMLRVHSDIQSGDDADWSAYMAAVAARRVTPAEMAAVPRGEGSVAAQAAFVQMGRAYDNLRAAGVQTAAIPARMVSALVGRGGWDEASAAEVVGSFVRDVEALRARPTSRAAGAAGEPPRLPPPSGGGLPPEPPGPPRRQVDRIDIESVPPPPAGYVLENPVSGAFPLIRQPSLTAPAMRDEIARSIRPEDVVPIPGNRIESLEEARRANPGTIQDIRAPDVEAMQELRTYTHPIRGTPVKHRGPLDVEAFLRSRGGLRDQGGELRHMGITDNRARPESKRESHLGPILNPSGLTLDEAGEALFSAGYLPERPTTADVVELLREGRIGLSRRTYRREDLGTLEEVENAEAMRFDIERAAQEGMPLADQVGQPIGRDDLDAMEPALTAYEDLPRLGGMVGNINLANIETPVDIRRLLQSVTDRMAGFREARRGTITHAETRQFAQELGMTVDDLLRRRVGQALNAEEIDAARLILAKSSDEVTRLSARAFGPEASDQSRIAFSEAMLRHVAIHEQVTGATAEMGRGLSALRMMARSKDRSGKIHKLILEGVGGERQVEAIAAGIKGLEDAGKDAAEISRYAVDAMRPKLKDKLVELWYNWLLSGPQTHAVNMLSNFMTASLQIPEQALASGIGYARRLGRGALGKPDDFDRVMASEIGPRIVGLLQGAKEGARNAARTFFTGEVTDAVTKIEAARQRAIPNISSRFMERHPVPLPFGKELREIPVGSAIRTFTRALAAEDEFFKAVARRMELSALATRAAKKEGLRGDAFRQRVADITANPPPEMLERVMDYGRYLTFQRPLAGFPSDVSRLTQRQPWLKLFLPFIRTPTNIFKFAVERSPLAPLLREVRENYAAGGEKRALAMARVALGTAFGYMVTQWAADGIITGSGPQDQAERDLLIANRWQPYSVRVGDTYYSYQRLDPLAMTLGTAANLASMEDRLSEGEYDEAGAAFIASIINNLSNKTWMGSIADISAVVEDPDRNLHAFVSRLGGSLAVPTGVAQIARSTDPLQRETRGDTISESVYNRIQSRIPGVSESLPARRDIFGRELRQEGGAGPDFASPIWTSSARNDPVAEELLAIGASLGRPSRTLTIGGVERDLTSREYSAYQQLAGQYIRDDIASLIVDPEYQASSNEERRERVRQTARVARADARADLFPVAPSAAAPPAGFELVQ